MGLYVGNGAFINASSGAGKVVVSHLDDPYWLQRYLGAKRIQTAGANGADRERAAKR